MTDHPFWPLTLECRWQVDLQCSPAMWPAMWRATRGREGRWGGRLALGWQMHHTSKPSNSGAQPLAPLAFSDPWQPARPPCRRLLAHPAVQQLLQALRPKVQAAGQRKGEALAPLGVVHLAQGICGT